MSDLLIYDASAENESQIKVDKDYGAADDELSIDSGYPEGGRDAVMAVIGAFLSGVIHHGMVNLTGAFQAQYARDELRGMSQSKISWIGTFLSFLYFFAAAPIGRCFDSTGPTLLLTAGSVLVVMGLMMVSLCKDYYQFFLAQGVAIGLGSALVSYPATCCLAHYYDKKRGTMMGVATTGSSVGAVFFPIALNKLIPVVGFPWAVRIVGFICLALAIPMVLVTKARLPRRKFVGWRNVVDFGGLRDIQYVLWTLGAVMTGLCLYTPYFYAQTYSERKGYSTNISFYIVAMMNAASFFGRIVPGLVADHVGAFNSMAIFNTLAASVLLCWLAVSGPAGLVVWGIAYGFLSGNFLSLAPTCLAQLTADMTKYGGRSGLTYGITSLGVLGSGPIAGALIDANHGQFEHMIIFAGTGFFGAGMFYWAARFAGNSRLLVKY
ncbi:hypothetical protein EUX98_g5413 [Antrodiella citrinella]|uniref:Major facilitator superfamily (MFS) profile domain-containing protein n=1 Tax=Antrodiella citrinella TaxID=2447956 RepID=A0A4V3XID1_9APHY|nr:hypothetical protein EUX98_g5413 [Antrodiella citrinella]